MATVSRIHKIIGLFSRILALLWVSFAKETCNLIDPTNCSHPIAAKPVNIKRQRCIGCHILPGLFMQKSLIMNGTLDSFPQKSPISNGSLGRFPQKSPIINGSFAERVWT